MGVECTIVCLDNSDYMRNGDYLPTRLQAQQEAVNMVCNAKTRQHPENSVGLVTLGGGRVLLTLTSDLGRILSKLHEVQPSGEISFISSIRIAQLALKHRLGKHHRQRIVAFVGSPIDADDKDIIKLAKRLKKEKVNVDIVNFGEEGSNGDKLSKFIDTINGKDGTSSHLVSVPPGPMLCEALMHSPVLANEDGQPTVVPGMGSSSGYSPFDFDPDPELTLALRVSMEEQSQRVNADRASKPASEGAQQLPTIEEAALQSALAMSVDPSGGGPAAGNLGNIDFNALTEEQQIALALQMSLAEAEEPMETETPAAEPKQGEEDPSEQMDDPEFLQGVLEGLPGVDTQSAEIQHALSQLNKKDEKDDKDKGSSS